MGFTVKYILPSPYLVFVDSQEFTELLGRSWIILSIIIVFHSGTPF